MKRISPDDFTTSIPKKPRHYTVYRSNENFTVLPTGKAFQGFSAIIIPYAPVTVIPEDLRSLHWLTMLDLSCGKLTTLPDSLCTLVNLRNLQLCFNEIAWISPKIDQMKNMEHLDLSNNYLTTVPVEMGNLKKLLTLHLQSNRLESIPLRLNRLIQLRELHLYGNKNLVVPLEVGALQFTQIYLNCKLSFGPAYPFGICKYGDALKKAWKKSTFILTLLNSQFDCDTPILEAFFEVSTQPCVVLE
jgi:Leucine rich repeat